MAVRRENRSQTPSRINARGNRKSPRTDEVSRVVVRPNYSGGRTGKNTVYWKRLIKQLEESYVPTFENEFYKTRQLLPLNSVAARDKGNTNHSTDVSLSTVATADRSKAMEWAPIPTDTVERTRVPVTRQGRSTETIVQKEEPSKEYHTIGKRKQSSKSGVKEKLFEASPSKSMVTLLSNITLESQSQDNIRSSSSANTSKPIPILETSLPEFPSTFEGNLSLRTKASHPIEVSHTSTKMTLRSHSRAKPSLTTNASGQIIIPKTTPTLRSASHNNSRLTKAIASSAPAILKTPSTRMQLRSASNKDNLRLITSTKTNPSIPENLPQKAKPVPETPENQSPSVNDSSQMNIPQTKATMTTKSKSRKIHNSSTSISNAASVSRTSSPKITLNIDSNKMSLRVVADASIPMEITAPGKTLVISPTPTSTVLRAKHIFAHKRMLLKNGAKISYTNTNSQRVCILDRRSTQMNLPSSSSSTAKRARSKKIIQKPERKVKFIYRMMNPSKKPTRQESRLVKTKMIKILKLPSEKIRILNQVVVERYDWIDHIAQIELASKRQKRLN